MVYLIMIMDLCNMIITLSTLLSLPLFEVLVFKTHDLKNLHMYVASYILLALEYT